MIDWTKPIETVPDALNPKPVPCEVVRICGRSYADVRFLAPVIDSRDGGPLHLDSIWSYNPDGTANDWLPRLRNVAPAEVFVLDHHDKPVPLVRLSEAEAARLSLDM